ncbi:sugar transferase [Salmonirosea aquatica]|uniref:Sugar transferase n=1 Tax=Salmonirosea aquatica TaxID=2654236 RepID=A0A7C9F826_9BACT|nr:sugar transferase [Cytophagaceae bacterium SJW1-29]
MLTYPELERAYIEPNNIVLSSKVTYDHFTKRLFDLVVVIILFIFLLSWLVPILSILVYCSSPGPIFFKQFRTGLNGRIFYCYKFRSMYVYGPGDFKQARRNDPRVTPIGRWLRKSNLDELPQFLNVLRGDMSLIGPRPHPLPLDAQFCYEIPDYEKRYQIHPGMTGLAQAKGVRGLTDHPLKMKHRVKYDLFYLKHRSLALDIAICWWTITSMAKGNVNAI